MHIADLHMITYILIISFYQLMQLLHTVLFTFNAYLDQKWNKLDDDFKDLLHFVPTHIKYFWKYLLFKTCCS